MGNSIGIYIHIPFCKAKCNYCDFNSYSGREHLAGPYFRALFSEMELRADSLKDRPVKTVFIGGGTPTLVEPRYVVALMELCSKLFRMEDSVEISMESNPGTLSYESLKAYRAAGVNRLSIGLQAWQDGLLKELGRIHDRKQFEENFEAAVKAGFRNINADLIFGLPNQTFEAWAETLEAVTALGIRCGPGKAVVSDTGVVSEAVNGSRAANGPDEADGSENAGDSGAASHLAAVDGSAESSGSALTHLSCYSLKIEEGTVFGDRYDAGSLKPADDELDRKMYHYAVDFLARKGFRQYEISNFARPGFECRHNLVYWKAREYAGFGAGAHSYLNGMRFSNVAGIEQYIAAVEQIGRNVLNEQNLYTDIQFINKRESMAEFMILGLRLMEGICADEFKRRFGENLPAVYGDKLSKLMKAGLLLNEGENYAGGSKNDAIMGDGCFKLTPLGLDVSNQVFIEFI